MYESHLDTWALIRSPTYVYMSGDISPIKIISWPLKRKMTILDVCWNGFFFLIAAPPSYQNAKLYKYEIFFRQNLLPPPLHTSKWTPLCTCMIRQAFKSKNKFPAWSNSIISPQLFWAFAEMCATDVSQCIPVCLLLKKCFRRLNFLCNTIKSPAAIDQRFTTYTMCFNCVLFSHCIR